MNKTSQTGSILVIGIIAVLVLIIGAGAAYFATDGFGTNEQTETEAPSNSDKESSSQENPTNKSATGADTMPLVKTALQGEGDVKCTVDSKTSDGKNITSTMYIRDRDNVLIEIPDDSGQLNSLFVDQANSYIWAEGNDRGTKSPLSEDDRTTEEQWQENIDDLKNGDGAEVSCVQTSLDDSLFEIPSSVTFSDLGKFIN